MPRDKPHSARRSTRGGRGALTTRLAEARRPLPALPTQPPKRGRVGGGARGRAPAESRVGQPHSRRASTHSSCLPARRSAAGRSPQQHLAGRVLLAAGCPTLQRNLADTGQSRRGSHTWSLHHTPRAEDGAAGAAVLAVRERGGAGAAEHEAAPAKPAGRAGRGEGAGLRIVRG